MLSALTVGGMAQRYRRARTAKHVIVGHDALEVAALGGLAARVKNRRAGVINEGPVGGAQMGLHLVDHWHQAAACTPDPSAKLAAVEVEPLPLEYPGLSEKWKVVAELGDDDP